MKDMKAKNIKRIMSEGDNIFCVRLKEARLLSGLTRRELGRKIGKTDQQIQRYESLNVKEKQYPTLQGFKNLCIELQVIPSWLLGIVWNNCEKNPESGIIYTWKIVYDYTAIHWICPKCKRKNVTYGEWGEMKRVKQLNAPTIYDLVLNIEKLKCENYICEYDDCGEYYERLYEIEDKVKIAYQVKGQV